MPFISLGKEREALHARSEQYKASVTKYLTSRNYNLDMDSSVEGTYEDQVYFVRGRMKVIIECKDTDTSIYDSEFLVPFGRHLARFTRHSPDERFSLIYCTRSVRNPEPFREIFEHLDIRHARTLLAKSIDALRRTANAEAIRAAEVLVSVDDETLLSFMEKTEVIAGSYEDFERAARMKPPPTHSSFLQSLSSPKRWRSHWQRWPL